MADNPTAIDFTSVDPTDDDGSGTTGTVINASWVNALQAAIDAVLATAAPTISSGFGTSPSIVSSNGTHAFVVNVGTGGSATAGVIALPTATTGWNATVSNLTAQAANVADARTVITAETTTTITIENQTVSTGAALAWTASDILMVTAIQY